MSGLGYTIHVPLAMSLGWSEHVCHHSLVKLKFGPLNHGWTLQVQASCMIIYKTLTTKMHIALIASVVHSTMINVTYYYIVVKLTQQQAVEINKISYSSNKLG